MIRDITCEKCGGKGTSDSGHYYQTIINIDHNQGCPDKEPKGGYIL